MKRKKTTYSVVSFLLLLIVSLVLSSCESSRVGPDIGRPNPPAPGSVPLILNGIVVDNVTGGAIAGATVLIQGTNLSTTTNGSGIFTFRDISSISAASVNLLASDLPTYQYGTGIATIDKTNNTSSFPVIVLGKTPAGFTNPSVTSGSGGSGLIHSPEAASGAAGSDQISFGPGVVPTGQSISVTIIAIPVSSTPASADPTTTNDISDVLITFTPAVTLNAPGATVNFALPYQICPGTQLSLRSVSGNAWQLTGLNATVDITGFNASVNILTAGTYGLFDAVGIIKSIGANSIPSGALEQTASSTSGNTSITLQNSLTYTPPLIPSNFSTVWSTNLLFKILQLFLPPTSSVTYSYVTYLLNFPTLDPSRISSQGTEFNPDFPNVSGDWYYRWFYIQFQNSSTVTLKNTTTCIPFTLTYVGTLTGYIIEDVTTGTTKKTTWYWVAHNQGGIGLPY
jgi:hypothetical protein